MPCSDCGYALRNEQADCPRCQYRSHVRQTPETPVPPAQATAERSPVPAPVVSVAAPPRRGGRWTVAALCVAAVGGLLLAWPLLHAQRQAQAASAQAGTVFARADGPCRRGDEVPCRGSISALVALRDHSDAAFLLGDFRVARYLQTQPGGEALEERWRQDGFSADELMALGEVARRQNLRVYRSFWMYANVKRDHLSVPTLTINNDPSPFGSR